MNCPFCNQTIPDGSAFCGFCGKKLDEVQPEVEAPETVPDEATEAAVEEAVETAASSASSLYGVPESAVSAPAFSLYGVPETAVSAPVSSASGTEASGAAVTVTEAPTENRTNAGTSPVNLAKAQSAADARNTANPANDMANQIRNGLQGAAQAAQGDAKAAAAAVKSGRFKDLLRNKTVLICCAAVIVIILLIVIIACCASGGSKLKIKGSYYRVNDGGDVVYLYNGAVVKGTDFSSKCMTVAASLDETAVLVKDGDELYMLKNGKAALITDEFDTSSASISANGKTVAYASDDAVYVYTGGKPKKIADIENDDYCFPVVSPDGKAVAFSDMDDDDINTYAWKGGKAIDLDADIIPFSISNGGKMIYGVDLSGDLSYIRNLKKDADEKIDSISSLAGISLDHTKLLYISDGSTYCFDTSMDDEEGVRITRGVISMISDFSYQELPYIENFKKFYGWKNGDLYEYFRKGKGYDDEKLVSDASGLSLSEDGKSFVYLDDGDVMKGTLSNAKNAKKVGKDAISFRANDSLSSVFYLDDDYNLRYAGKDGKIASDVGKYLVTDGGVCVFSDTDDELYYSVKGGAKKKAGLDDIESLGIRNDVVYVVSDGELYTSTNGKSFKKTGVEVD